MRTMHLSDTDSALRLVAEDSVPPMDIVFDTVGGN
jgi:hypothetical protein